MSDNLLPYSLALSLLPGLNAVSARKLMEFFGGSAAVFGCSRQDLMVVPGIRKELVDNILRADVLEKAQKEMISARELGIRLYDIERSDYPYRLRECEDAPLAFFCLGEVDLDAEKIVAVVGTRSATEYGKRLCRELVEGFVAQGCRPLIVSGLAFGIDISAHRAALECGLPTVAVLAHGLDQVYPSHHRRDAAAIIRQGGLVSEFVLGTPSLPFQFVQRNRIIAGLADATVVVESAEKGGSLITAELADSYHRDVMAFPGRVSDPYSKGCHFLIRTQRAQLVESARDVSLYLGWNASGSESAPVQGTLFEPLSEAEQRIVDWLRLHQRATVDSLCVGLSISVAELSSLLLQLELSGWVRCLPGKIYICERQ